MYKKFFMGIAAMAALTLVSCSSDDLNSLSDNSSKNEAISFDGYLGRSAVAVNGSRGSVLEKDQLQNSEDGFGVFGNYNSTGGQNFGSNLFDNQQVTYSSTESKWKYSPFKYWPAQGHIDFLAYAPRVDGKTLKNNTSNKTTCIDFTVSPTIADQKDLLWANATNKTKADKTVTFTFNHALAKIGYAVKKGVADDNVTITLNKITLAGSATDPAVGAFYTDGTIDLSKDLTNRDDATVLWTSCTGKQPFTWSAGFPEVTGSYASSSDYLFVIPQDFSTGTELDVIVDYTISYKKGATATMKSTVSSQIKKKFEQGKAYMINLTIGLTPIEFEADVTTWKDGDKIDDITWN